jgi:hypothetical protein
MYVTLLAMCIGDALRHYILYRKELGDFETEESSMRKQVLQCPTFQAPKIPYDPNAINSVEMLFTPTRTI